MKLTLRNTVHRYFAASNLANGTQAEYRSTLNKWEESNAKIPISKLGRREIAEFLDHVYASAKEKEGTNPGRTSNKAREQLRAVMSWAWDQEIIDSLPRFPKLRKQRDVAGRHYLTKSELNSLYFATYKMKRPRGWSQPFDVGKYWRCALVLFFNYGLDTGTVWTSKPDHKPILWKHISWDTICPDGQVKERSRWGWLFYRRVKTGKVFYRPMNRTVHAHIKSLKQANFDPDFQLVLGGGCRPNARFKNLCNLAGLSPKKCLENEVEKPWLLKDLRKTCATYYDQHVPESAIEILGHSVGGITYRHYAHRSPLAFKAIMTLPQPTAFTSLSKGHEGRCPCCRREF